ncbi:hypothetical protein PG991_011507 [Apiospora marii]|uniref:DUF7580 domain-containing protein n=1 Tax=Apiospora marii TaxID=335849 RepID=A0ABR1RGD7_9PEZI
MEHRYIVLLGLWREYSDLRKQRLHLRVWFVTPNSSRFTDHLAYSIFQPGVYPVLEGISHLSRNGPFNVNDLVDPQAIGSYQPWKAIHVAAENIIDDLTHNGADIDEVDGAHNSHFGNAEFNETNTWEFADRTLKALHCKCSPNLHRDVRLKIETGQGLTDSHYMPSSLSILATDDASLPVLYELRIHDRTNVGSAMNRKSKVTFLGASNTEDDVNISDSSPLCIHEAFERLEGDNSQCIDMEIRGNGLYFSNSFLVKRELMWVDTLRSEKTLKYLLHDSPKERWAQAEVSRIVLGLMLAKNLHYFYGSTWIETGWSRDKIFFIEEGAQVPLRPFFGTSTSPIKSVNPGVTAFLHRYPEILELGVTLLEMKIGEPLERFLNLKHTLRDIDEYFKKATDVFNRQKDHIFSVAYKNAIDTCLRPNLKISPGNGGSHDVRSMLFDHVVKPLQKEVMGRFPEYFKPGSI